MEWAKADGGSGAIVSACDHVDKVSFGAFYTLTKNISLLSRVFSVFFLFVFFNFFNNAYKTDTLEKSKYSESTTIKVHSVRTISRHSFFRE